MTDTINTVAHSLYDEDLPLSLKQETGRGLSVLLVEDEKSQALLIAAVLNQYGHKVHIAYSGEQAIEMFRELKPDLVLMDVILPGINGYETTQTIRAEHKEWVPIIFLSGRSEKADRLYALKVGGGRFLSQAGRPD